MKLSPLGRRRWQLFKANKRGYWSCVLFIILFVLSLFAEFIANDKPILLKYQDNYYMPILRAYDEKTFGGELESETDYRDPFIAEKINAEGWMVWPVIRFNASTINYELTTPAPSPPTAINLLGTDDQGRDVLARVIYGVRISVLFALILTGIGSVLGIMAGAVQGYYGGKTDLIFQRVLEIWGGMPVLFLLIILSSFIEPNFWWLLGIMLLFSWTSLVDVVRAEFLRARNFDFVKAARALGVKDRTIMFRHILPNALVASLTFIPFHISGALTTLTVLDFLGFGLPAGSPSLGELAQQGKANPQAPWLGISGFFSLSVILILLIFTGEAVRDALNPRKSLRK